MFALGIIGEALAGQRVIAQRIFERVRRLELESGVSPSHYEPGASPATSGRFRVETLTRERSDDARARDSATREQSEERPVSSSR
jgi:hypothetical protein